MFSAVAMAQQSGAQGPGLFEQLVPIILILVIFYFLLILPQQRRQKKHQEFLANLKRGDSVLTSGGIFGTIEGITERFVTLEIAEGVRIRVLKNQIASPAEEEQQQ